MPGYPDHVWGWQQQKDVETTIKSFVILHQRDASSSIVKDHFNALNLGARHYYKRFKRKEDQLPMNAFSNIIRRVLELAYFVFQWTNISEERKVG